MRGRIALAVGVLSLGVGPWLGLPSAASISPWSASAPAGWGASLLAQPLGERDLPIPSRVATGCGCREITVTADNVVKNADIETGDSEVINRSITYIAPTYGDDDVDVDQEAIAHSGDAVAGQVLSVSDGGNGCAHIHVQAKNDVENAKVRSGDATAINESVVLLDPRLNTEDLDIDVDQEAEAKSGDAIAGQIIGVAGMGGPCGSVILDALNKVKNVELQTGDSTISNRSQIVACKQAGCLDEVRRLLADDPVVEVCDDSGCHPVASQKVVGMLRESAQALPAASSSPPAMDPRHPATVAAQSGEPDDTPPPMPRWFIAQQRPVRAPGPSPTPSVDPDATPTPTPTPQTWE